MAPARQLGIACMALLFATTFTGVLAAMKAAEKYHIPGPLPDYVVDAQTWAEYPETVTAKRPAGYEKADHLWWHEINGTQQWEDPTLIRTADDGTETYIDSATGKETTNKPVEAAWLTLYDDDNNAEYFHNTMTKETTWHLPQILAWQKLHVDAEGSITMPPEEADDEGESWPEGDEEDWHDSEEEEVGEDSGEAPHGDTASLEEDQAEANEMVKEALESNGDQEENETHSDL